MKMEITFPGGAAVESRFKGHTVRTDQPEHAGGRDSAPAPFDLFLSSIGTCAGFYALRFCEQRGLSTAGLKVYLEPVKDPEAGRLAAIRLQVALPQGFPEKYHAALLRSMDQCAVKRHVVEAPEFEVGVLEAQPA